MAHMWRSEDNLQELVLSLHYWVTWIDLRSLDSVASIFTH